MIIRKATLNDLDQIMQIYENARQFMRDMGNGNQWKSTYPPREMIENDIGSKMYVCTENGDIACVFYYAAEHDSTYDVVYDGAWLNDNPYGVVHRIASSRTVKGAARFCLNWAFNECGNLKIDTHRDNVPMQKLLTSLGFKNIGIIHLANGEERLAFQKEG